MQLCNCSHYVRSPARSRSLGCTQITRAPHSRCHLRCQVSKSLHEFCVCQQKLDGSCCMGSRAQIFQQLMSICILACRQPCSLARLSRTTQPSTSELRPM